MFAYKEQSHPLYSIITRIVIVCAGTITGLIIARNIVVPYSVSGESMMPNLKKNDIVFILRHSTPETGDIVLFTSPVEPDRVLLRRIIGKEGDLIEVRNKVLFKNDQRYRFPWKIRSRDARIFPMGFTERDNMPAVKLHHRQYFVLGDNLDTGFDSRYFGIIDEDRIIGTVIYKL